MKNHSNCTCRFIGHTKVSTRYEGFDPSEVYPAQIWETKGGVKYFRVFLNLEENPDLYHKIPIDQCSEHL